MFLNFNFKVVRFSDMEIYKEIYGFYIESFREMKKMLVLLLLDVFL